MKIRNSAMLGLALTMLGGLGMGAVEAPAMAASTGKSSPQDGRIVSETPAGNTPAIMDGTVLSMTKVGGTIVVGGTFTTVRNPGSSVDIPRHNLFAFDEDTGKVKSGFAPEPDGAVYKVLPVKGGKYVYVGGDFRSLAYAGKPVSASRLVKLKVSSGTRDRTFKPGKLDGQVRDLEVTGSRLWVAGKFTHVHGKAQKALVSLRAKSGAYDSYFTKKFAGVHRTGYPSDVTNVLSITTDPKNKRLVAIGNFTSVSGTQRAQIATFNLAKSSAKLANWNTHLFESTCAHQFETTMTDTSFSPDGSYFIVATTGSYGGKASLDGTSGCDVVARFKSSSTGTDIRPAWTAYDGGDSTWSVEVTADAVYVGGHQRWQNNPGGDNVAAEGAVERTGIAALDPVNGLPLAWNPRRLPRGMGVRDMLATKKGLYVGSDTTVFGGRTRYRLAFVPLAGGAKVESDPTLKLKGTVVTVARGSSQAVERKFTGKKVTSGPTVSSTYTGGLTGAVGAFMRKGVLYVAHADGSFTKRKVGKDGSLGSVSAVDAADSLVRQAGWHDGDVPSLTSLFYRKGRIYFTLAGKNVLYSRAFEASDDVVGQLRTSSSAPSGIDYRDVRGAFVSDGNLYYGVPSGSLFVADWSGTRPVAGTAKRLTKAGTGWASAVLFQTQR